MTNAEIEKQLIELRSEIDGIKEGSLSTMHLHNREIMGLKYVIEEMLKQLVGFKIKLTMSVPWKGQTMNRDSKLKREDERMRESSKDVSSWHACGSGDCPHDDFSLCIQTLYELGWKDALELERARSQVLLETLNYVLKCSRNSGGHLTDETEFKMEEVLREYQPPQESESR